MSRKSLSKSESAAAIAIAAVLLLGFAFTLISVVKLNYAPEWKIDAERDYSYDAWSSMEDVKTRGEIFTRVMESDINYPYGLSATVPFSMGGGDVPVFEPSKSNSKLAVNNENCTMIITLANHSDDPRTIDCGGITYYSENRQYPDQIFRYENGALILAQDNNSQMKHDPLFNISEAMGNYTVRINAISLTGETESISSSTLTALSLTGCSVDTEINSDVYKKANETIESFNLTIYTHYTDAWTAYLNNIAKDAKLKYGINYTINSTDDCVYISFLPTYNKNYNIYVNKTVLCAELGRKGEGGNLPGGSLPGGSENVMKLGTWYPFELSDNGTAILPLKDYKTGLIFPAISGIDVKLVGYDDASYEPDSSKYTLSAPFRETFRFNSFTEFESNVSKVTVRMIYRSETNPTSISSLVVSGNSFDKLEPYNYNQQQWYIFNETRTISVNYPSELNLSMNVGQESGNKVIYIDYLAVRLD